VTCTVAKATSLEEDMRSAGTELISTLLQKAPGMVKRSQNFVQETVTLALTLLAEVTHPTDLNEWNEEEDENDAKLVNIQPQSLGKDLLYRAAVCLKGELILPMILQLIPLYMQSGDWIR
jgi:hypothetical protein